MIVEKYLPELDMVVNIAYEAPSVMMRRCHDVSQAMVVAISETDSSSLPDPDGHK